MAKKRPDRARDPEKGRDEGPAPDQAGPSTRPELSSRHRATLARIFARPTRPDIPWRDIEGLFMALGAIVETGSGSRRWVKLGERRAVFHEPHPERVTDKGAVVQVRRFLLSAGVKP